MMDVLREHRKVPTTAHDRVCDLSAVVAARANASVRISWPAMFIKAYGLVARRYVVLRQTFMPWPWAHLYQHPESVATVVVHREIEQEPWILWAKLPAPESQPLDAIQRRLDKYQTHPVERVFRMQWLLSGLPSFLRRLIWWWTLNVSGQTRAKRTGTFLLTTIGSRGAEIQHPPGFLTGNLTFGPIDQEGRCRVTLAYDHRLLDGRMVAEILADLEHTLNATIAAELSTLDAQHARAAA